MRGPFRVRECMGRRCYYPEFQPQILPPPDIQTPLPLVLIGEGEGSPPAAGRCRTARFEFSWGHYSISSQSTFLGRTFSLLYFNTSRTRDVLRQNCRRLRETLQSCRY